MTAFLTLLLHLCSGDRSALRDTPSLQSVTKFRRQKEHESNMSKCFDAQHSHCFPLSQSRGALLFTKQGYQTAASDDLDVLAKAMPCNLLPEVPQLVEQPCFANESHTPLSVASLLVCSNILNIEHDIT